MILLKEMILPSTVQEIYFSQSASQTFSKVDAWSDGLGILTQHNMKQSTAIIDKMAFPKDGKILASELNKMTRYFWAPMQKAGLNFVCTKDEVKPLNVLGYGNIKNKNRHTLYACSKVPTPSGSYITIRCTYIEKLS